MNLKINKILIAMVLVFGVIYVYLTSVASSSVYKIDSMDQKISDLKEQKAGLVVELSKTKTPDFILEKSHFLNLVESSGSTRFIDARSSSLGRASN